MLDIKILRQNPEIIVEALKKRNNDLDITPAIELDKQRREILVDVEQKKASQNEISKKIPQMKKAGEDPTSLIESMKKLGDEIKANDDKIAELETYIQDFLDGLPNPPLDDVPAGGKENNKVMDCFRVKEQ